MVYFVRHGDKAAGDYYNEEKKICDEPLSEKGKEDAQRIARYFCDMPFARLYASEYVRAQQTAQPLALKTGKDVIVDARVNEINGGEFHRLGDEKAKQAYPEVWNTYKNHLGDFMFPGGESGSDVKKRQDSFLEEIKHEEQDIVVVSHDGYIRLLMCNILGLPGFKRYKFTTQMGSVSAVFYDGEEWRIKAFNQII